MNLDNIYSNHDLSKYYNFLVLLALKGNEKYPTDKAKLYLTDESDLNLMFEINKLYCGFTFNDNIYTIEPNGRGLITNDTLTQIIDKQRQQQIKDEKIKLDVIRSNKTNIRISYGFTALAILISILALFIPTCQSKDVVKTQQSVTTNHNSNQTNSNTNITSFP